MRENGAVVLRIAAFVAAVALLWMAQSAGSYAVDEWTIALIAAKPQTPT